MVNLKNISESTNLSKDVTHTDAKNEPIHNWFPYLEGFSETFIENILNNTDTEFLNVLDWLRERACARQHGLGTKIPWDNDWLVESLADSVIYMSFYTMAKFVNSGEILAENMNDEFFNYIFYGNGDSEIIAKNAKITTEKLEEIRKEFLYFY